MDEKDYRKASTGTYRVRGVSRDLHRAARLRAASQGTTLRWGILQALQAYSTGTWTPPDEPPGARTNEEVGGMTDNRLPEMSSERFLRYNAGRAFCQSCLAIHTGLSRQPSLRSGSCPSSLWARLGACRAAGHTRSSVQRRAGQFSRRRSGHRF